MIHVAFVTANPVANAETKGYLYQARFVQAAPGKLLELIDLYKTQNAELKKAGEETPLWIRHSQGDKWDLLILLPIGSYSHYFGADRLGRRQAILDQFRNRLQESISWQEDLFVFGPPLEELRAAFSRSAFFHLESFQSLPGKQTDLYKEREMENAYSRALKRPENFIFVRDQGASWDLFTIGCYRDLKHYAESADIPEKDQREAAKAAGFESSSRIGPYLRALISQHHDTLAVSVK